MKAKAGGEHTLLENNEGQLFSAGACGLGWCRELPYAKELFAFRPVSFQEKNMTKKIKLFHASYYHNLALSGDGRTVYSWGCGVFPGGGLDGVIPALGRSATGKAPSDRGERPTKIALPNKDDVVCDITGGAYHSVLLTKSGKVYTFGAGQLGQLGRKTGEMDGSGLPVDSNVKEADLLKENNDESSDSKVQAIGAGFYNTFAICKSGALYCTGENQNKQCGTGLKNLNQLTRVKEMSGITVDQVEGGYCHTLIKTLEGAVWSLGCGEEGQRGDGRTDEENDLNERKIATPVNLPAQGVAALQVAAGANHSLILGSNGVAYSFGANDVGQCGVPAAKKSNDDDGGDDDGSILSPRAIQLAVNEKTDPVVSVSAGYAHSALTTKSGKIFVFGQNDNGQLGLGRTNKENGKDDDGRDTQPQMTPLQVHLPS